jgi:hypothetical protein
MRCLLYGGGLLYNGGGDLAGAQTERRGGAGPVRGLLGDKDLTGRFSQNPIQGQLQSSTRRPSIPVSSRLFLAAN